MILDVRTPEEYVSGHVQGSINIPLQNLSQEIQKQNISKDTPIVVCCESGGRSEYAVRMLKELGFIDVTNGGSWRNLY